jgi:hypothetical protein
VWLIIISYIYIHLLPQQGWLQQQPALSVLSSSSTVTYAHAVCPVCCRVDTPFLDAKGRRINHFTRVETPGNNAQNGNNDVSW